jgi:hypothetical protein
MNFINLKYENNKYAYAGQLNSLTHTTALCVLHDCGILAHATTIAPLSIIIPPNEVDQIEKETIKGGIRCESPRWGAGRKRSLVRGHIKYWYYAQYM